MSTLFSRLAAAVTSRPAARLPAADELTAHFSSLYARAQTSKHVFGSPLGPFDAVGGSRHVPRFVYFGPHTSDESLRLAFYAGFEAGDLRGTHALLRFIERLAVEPAIGQGLNLSFFPLIDVLGAFQAQSGRGLASAHWARSSIPEINLLEQDARQRGYHGFVRLETVPAGEEVVVRVRAPRSNAIEPTGVEFISSEDFEPLPVRFEAEPLTSAPVAGPLTIADDLPYPPFELTLSLPAAWTDSLHHAAVSTLLRRFIRRYRGLHAYSQHL